MRYTITQQASYDFDIFFYDRMKIIHIATAGMIYDPLFEKIEFNLVENLRNVTRYTRLLNFEESANIVREDSNNMNDYTSFFIKLSRKGFYSYDRVNISNPEDYNFQLISKPIYERKITLLNENIILNDFGQKENWNYKNRFLKASNDFPLTSRVFDIREYL